MPTPRKHNSRAERSAANLQRPNAMDLPGLESIPTKPGPARWNALLNLAWAELETVRDDMQRELDRQPIEWQVGPEGAELREKIGKLSKAVAKCESMGEMPLDDFEE